jgi:hypothetical protein
LLVLGFFMDSDGDIMVTHRIGVPLSALWDWARTGASFVEWDAWKNTTVHLALGGFRVTVFAMGSRLVAPDMDALIRAIMNAQPPFADKIRFPILVYNMSPYRQMRTVWDPSGSHCQGVTGMWNTVTSAPGDGNFCRTVEILAEATSDVLMTEDSLVVIEMVRFADTALFICAHPAGYRARRIIQSCHSRFCRSERGREGTKDQPMSDRRYWTKFRGEQTFSGYHISAPVENHIVCELLACLRSGSLLTEWIRKWPDGV